jgi:ankyrin repeat protein
MVMYLMLDILILRSDIYDIIKTYPIKPDHVDNDGNTIYLLAVKYSDISILEILLLKYNKLLLPNYKSNCNECVLQMLYMNSYGSHSLKFVEAFHNILDLSYLDDNNNNFIMIACIYKLDQIVLQLISKFKDKINWTHVNNNKKTILMLAIENNYMKIVTDILKIPGNVSMLNIVDSDGYTPLLKSCEKDNKELVNLLIKNYTRDELLFTHKNKSNKTATDYIIYYKMKETLNYLISGIKN